MILKDETYYDAIEFHDHFSELPDPRQQIKVRYPLNRLSPKDKVLHRAPRTIERLQKLQDADKRDRTSGRIKKLIALLEEVS